MLGGSSHYLEFSSPNNELMVNNDDSKNWGRMIHSFVLSLDPGLVKIHSKYRSSSGSLAYTCTCRGDNIKTPSSGLSTTLRFITFNKINILIK